MNYLSVCSGIEAASVVDELPPAKADGPLGAHLVGSVSFIVCGWYTPDYHHWLPPLVASLDRLGHDHDFARVNKSPGGWEANTLRKARQIMAAMNRHSDRTMVFLDVDCIVQKPLDGMANITADVALHLVSAPVGRGYGRLFGRSGTMVLRQTDRARSMVSCWANLSDGATAGLVDQHTLTEAIARTPGLSIQHLDATFCALPKDGVLDPVIFHGGASRTQRKMPGWRRAVNRFLNRTENGPGSGGSIGG